MKEKRYNRLQMVAVALALLLTSLLLPSCSNEDGNSPELPENKLYTLTIHLQPSASYTPVTKAAGDEQDNPYERRLEHWWLLVYGQNQETNQDGLIEVVSDQTYQTNPTGDDSETAIELKLPIGTYRLYALANLNSLKKDSELIINEIESKNITEDGLKTKYAELITIDQFNVAEGATGKAIPMSSYATITTVQENQENTAKVALFRMLGKVRIDLHNQMDEDITLSKLSMGEFRKGPIFLLPYGDGPTNGAEPELPETVQFPNLPDGTNPEFSIHDIVKNGNVTLAQNNILSYTFYQYETAFTENQTTAHKGFTISVNAGNKELVDQEIDFDYMRRNDFLIIPITISNIQTTLSWSGSRMPIGGLPIKKEYGNNNGIQVGTPFYCNADYAGDVTVEFELNSISGIDGNNLELKYAGATTIAGQKYCEATLVDNTKGANQTEGLLIDKDNNNIVLNNNTKINLNHEDAEKLKGSFTVRTQELGKDSSAEIKLTLVATYGEPNNKREVVIPYTIIIQNYKNTSTTN